MATAGVAVRWLVGSVPRRLWLVGWSRALCMVSTCSSLSRSGKIPIHERGGKLPQSCFVEYLADRICQNIICTVLVFAPSESRREPNKRVKFSLKTWRLTAGARNHQQRPPYSSWNRLLHRHPRADLFCDRKESLNRAGQSFLLCLCACPLIVV